MAGRAEDQPGTPGADPPKRDPAQFNLEKPPLQTGRTEPDVSLRDKAAMSEKPWVIRRRMAGFVALILIAIVVVAAIVIMNLLDGAIGRHYVSP